MNEILKQKLLKLIADKPKNFGQCCKSKSNIELKNEILSATPLLDESYTFCTRIFWILHDIIDFPKCCICGKNITKNVWTLENGYTKHEKWSDENFSIITCDDKDCCNKQKTNNFKKTCLNKYGVENVWQVQSVKNKIKTTNIERYGAESAGNRPEGRKKAKQTCLKHFGVDVPLKSDNIKNKVRTTCLERYGETSYAKTKEYKTLKQRKNLDNFLKRLNEFNDPEIEFADIKQEQMKFMCIADFWNTKLHMKCKKCKNDFYAYPNANNFYKFGTYSSCQKCHPSFSASIYEKQINEFIVNACKITTIENSRRFIAPYELDIMIPEKNIALEYDGLYWHSLEENANYHLNKTELCKEKGIQLIHIFENEWLLKQDIVKSRIKNLLGIFDNVVYARNCQIKEVDSKISKQFQEDNHIQGAVNSKVNLGLYYDDELISLMTFGKCRFDKKHEWELLRFCNKLGYHIPGGASKLLKHFERNYNPKSLVSYADRRWSKGKLYEALGFKLDHISEPNYWYWKNGLSLLSRIQFQKHKLKNILPIFDNSLSESKNMLNNGYHRIYDCGNLVFEKLY